MLELTEKVRDLESENADLRKLTGEKREPKLKVEAFRPIAIELHRTSRFRSLRSFYKSLNRTDAKRLGIGMTAVQQFNRKIPKDAEINKLEERLNIRLRIMAGFSWFDIVIKNEGSAGATNISVNIEIPEGLEIYESIDIDMLTRVNIPNNKKPGDEKLPEYTSGLKT